MGKKLRKREFADNLKLTDKTHPFSGILSVLCFVCSITGFIVLCMISSESKGNGPLMTIGMGGMGCFALSIIGFILAAKTLKKEEIRYVFPNVGAVGNGILLVVYMLLYGMGLYM